MSTFDATKPLTTDNYSTVFVPTLVNNFASLAFGLDPGYVASYGTLSTGMQRFNRSGTGLWEYWTGSAWAAAVTGYARIDGSAPFAGSVSIGPALSAWNLSGYKALEIGGAGSGMYAGPNDLNITTNLYYTQSGGGWKYVNTGLGAVYQMAGGVHKWNVAASGASGATATLNTIMQMDASGLAVNFNTGVSFFANQPTTSEGYRVAHSSGYLSGYNSTNSTRTGYLQFNAGASVVLAAENGAYLNFSTAGAERWRVDASGNFAGQTTQSVISHNGTTGALTIVASPTLVDGTARIEMYDTAHATLAKQIVYRGDVHTWTRSGSGVQLMLLDTNGNVSPAGGLHATAGYTSIVGTGGNYNENLRLPRASNGYCSINLATDGSGAGSVAGQFGINVYPSGTNGGALYILSNGVEVQRTATSGAQTFFAGAATAPAAAANSGTTITLDCAVSNVFQVTMTGNVPAASFTLPNMQNGQTINVFLTQDGTGGRTLTLNSGSFKWPGGIVGALSTAAGAVDLLVITYRSAANAYYCTLAKGFA